jgi:hypothetical protein
MKIYEESEAAVPKAIKVEKTMKACNRGVTLEQARREVDEGRSRIYADVRGRGREKTPESSYQMKFQSKSQCLKIRKVIYCRRPR